jgi:hypothetical protein
MRIIFASPSGSVSDAGAPIVLTPVVAGSPVLTLPRYGVWKPIGGRNVVVMATDDLDAALALAARRTE